MKKYNRIILFAVFLWLIIAITSVFCIRYMIGEQKNKEYQVEINRIQKKISHQKEYEEINLSRYHSVRQIDYLPEYSAKDNKNFTLDTQKASGYRMNFFDGCGIQSLGVRDVPQNCAFIIKPLYQKGELNGYIRYSYLDGSSRVNRRVIILVEVIIGIAFLLAFGLLIYMKYAILLPFNRVCELPGELSKGHLSKGIKETKNRYFGKFLWGLDLLRQSLEEHRRKELQLEKDKKLMILSISHDIKTPLSTIKLYSKALYEDLYDTQEKRHSTARHIEEKADQIEHFVSEIMKASTSELFEFDVKKEDFYLSTLIKKVQETFTEKLELLKTDFNIQPYSDKILIGDVEKLIEVFDNIIQNSIKYGDGKRISISFEQEDNCQLIRIFNSGNALPVTDIIHMFESFWRGTNAHGKQGNGLGLYICRQMLKNMGGDIFAEAEDKGMSIILVLKKG